MYTVFVVIISRPMWCVISLFSIPDRLIVTKGVGFRNNVVHVRDKNPRTRRTGSYMDEMSYIYI